MKLYTCFTESHRVLFDDWFMPSIKDDISIEAVALNGAKEGAYGSQQFMESVRAKNDMIVQATKDNFGGHVIISDIDVQFFSPVADDLTEFLQKGYDIICQDDGPGLYCAGFFAFAANEKTLTLFEAVGERLTKEATSFEQPVFNNLIRRLGLKASYLPPTFFSYGQLLKKDPLRRVKKALGLEPTDLVPWTPGVEFDVPDGLMMHHANWTVGLKHKIELLQYVKRKVNRITDHR